MSIHATRPTRGRIAQNMYELARDAHDAVRVHVIRATDALGPGMADLILAYAAPFIYHVDPYGPDRRYVSSMARALWAATMQAQSSFFGMSKDAVVRIIAFLEPRVLFTLPIPCAITTIGRLPEDFNYDPVELVTRIRARGEAGLVSPAIRAVRCAKCPCYIAPGAPDPSDVALFGTAQTTFWIKTPHRDPDKTFAVKLFRKSTTDPNSTASIEILGVLWMDLRDGRDVNETLLHEVRAALGLPGLQTTSFAASMRNYRFSLANGYNIRLPEVVAIFGQMREAGRTDLFCSVDTDRCASAILEISVSNHTSHNKRLTIKIFQSGKINFDSAVYYDHVYTWYRFLNDFFVEHADRILYMPATEDDEYDSDYYYQAAGVAPPH